ncbi:MAG TPA: hypothetical protein VLH41_11120 [Thermoanaerobaculia bacterium]|nr:hypothetical protein [Thermoanaerobaculia bacterium]
MRRGLACLLAALLVMAGCTSGKIAERRAFLEAGREVRLRQPPPTETELKKDLDLFLEDDLLLTFDKAKSRERGETSTLRIVFVGGMAAVVVGATAGSLKDSGGWQAAVIGTGAAAMAYAALRYFGPVKDLHECQEYLARQEAALRQWEGQHVSESSRPVSPETWHEYVQMVSQIQLHQSCLVVR